MGNNYLNSFRLFVLVLFLQVFGFLNPVYSQTGAVISSSATTADATAVLDIQSTTKGLLIPRVSLISTTDVATVPSPATSLMVYNTNGSISGGSGTGFYYWNGSNWSKISSGAISGSGTTNNLTKWTSATGVTNSIMYDNGTIASVGSTGIASAKLQISATNKGLLLPQVSLISTTDATTIASPATSLMVYNTNAAITNGSGVGPYFYNGSNWEKIIVPQAIFTYWGKNTCPGTSTLVYAGYVAGAHFSHSGSGYNTVCLTNAPSWTSATYSDADNNGALFYGAEYETGSFGVSTYNTPTAYQNYDAVCAVCAVDGASVALMIPGTTVCPANWVQQYWGYVMADNYSGQYKSEFVCVVNTPTLYGTNANSDGTLWYPTETEMGVLVAATSGYAQDKEVPCTVCTK